MEALSARVCKTQPDRMICLVWPIQIFASQLSLPNRDCQRLDADVQSSDWKHAIKIKSAPACVRSPPTVSRCSRNAGPPVGASTAPQPPWQLPPFGWHPPQSQPLIRRWQPPGLVSIAYTASGQRHRRCTSTCVVHPIWHQAFWRPLFANGVTRLILMDPLSPQGNAVLNQEALLTEVRRGRAGHGRSDVRLSHAT